MSPNETCGTHKWYDPFLIPLLARCPPVSVPGTFGDEMMGQQDELVSEMTSAMEVIQLPDDENDDTTMVDGTTVTLYQQQQQRRQQALQAQDLRRRCQSQLSEVVQVGSKGIKESIDNDYHDHKSTKRKRLPV